ncbi:unnamed protein product [Linum trigynum]|uniref:RING-CH-type domain-containing protein n=1 Tax=Linum trigynum TaxID=586398 RepID=A0AAV2GM72_9ROSI
MSDHLDSGADRNIEPENSLPTQGAVILPSSGSSSSQPVDKSSCLIDMERVREDDVCDEKEPLLQTVECRICQEEDSLVNLEVPCACSGSLKYAHRKCVQRWCNEKGDIICEICRKPYQPGYTAPPPPPQSEDTAIDIGEGWTIAGTPLDLRDPRILAMAAAERHLLEAEYDEYADSSANGAAFCRSAALILMALLLLRHAMSLSSSDGDDDDDASTFFSLFLLRAAGFLLPCYIMAWAISILQRRRQRQEAEALSASEVAFMIQAGQHPGLHFTVAAGPAFTTPEEAAPSPPPRHSV